ncbi:relaxase domain-containing protein [Streptomyces bacillaris]|uniref:relaxase domain-containing protein n=1 Tax=Streptomyces bacillaris TaxID=68179 RepID=UPI0033458587
MTRAARTYSSIHTTALHENTVAASALCNELVASEVCEELGLATEPRIVTPGRRPVMEIAGVPHGLIRWTARRSDQIATCLSELEQEYVTAVDDGGELRFLPVVSERARAKLSQIAARKTRPPKKGKGRLLAQLRADWKANAIRSSGVPADAITSLLEYTRAAAAAIRARVAAVVDIALAAVDVALCPPPSLGMRGSGMSPASRSPHDDGPLHAPRRCRDAAPGTPGRSAGIPPAGARAAPRPRCWPLSGPDGARCIEPPPS